MYVKAHEAKTRQTGSRRVYPAGSGYAYRCVFDDSVLRHFRFGGHFRNCGCGYRFLNQFQRLYVGNDAERSGNGGEGAVGSRFCAGVHKVPDFLENCVSAGGNAFPSCIKGRIYLDGKNDLCRRLCCGAGPDKGIRHYPFPYDGRILPADCHGGDLFYGRKPYDRHTYLRGAQD